MNMISKLILRILKAFITIHHQYYPLLPYLSSKLLKILLKHKLIIRHLTSKHLYEIGFIGNFT